MRGTTRRQITPVSAELDAHLRSQGTLIAVPSKIEASTRQCLLLLTALTLAMATLLALLSDTGHDQLWLLLAAQRIGPHLNPYGPTVFESNPPLALWLSAIVVAIAHLLHLASTVTLKLAVTAVIALSAFACHRLVLPLQSRPTPARRWLLALSWLLVFAVIPARDFGQRDHLLTLLILPYLCAAACHLSPSATALSLPPRLALAFAAALGIALKPHHALIPIAVELTLWLLPTHKRKQSRPSRPRLLEPLVFLLAAAAYLLATHLLAPTYFTDILPLLRDTYWAFGHLTVLQLLLASLSLQILLVLSIAAAILQCRRRTLQPLPLLLTIAGVAATVAYLAQGTGWYYQQLPGISLFLLALALQAASLPALSSRITSRLPLPLAALTFLTLSLATYFSDFHLNPTGRFPANLEQSQPTPDPVFFANLPPDSPVATLTTAVDDTVPAAFRYNLTLAQRYPHFWMLPAILRNQSGPPPAHPIPPERLARLDLLQHRFMVEDLTRWRPVLILVARCQDPAVHCQVLEDRHDDLLAFFLRDPAFAAIFVRYHLTARSGPYDAYTLMP